MLISMTKGHDDRSCDCQVVCYAERIWIENVNANCVRDVIIQVKEDSLIPLSKFRMLFPIKRNIVMFEDRSETYFDRNYIYNGYATNGFELLGCDADSESGTIRFDGFECTVSTNNTISQYAVPHQNSLAQAIAIDFKEPILPGSCRAIRIAFGIKAITEELFTTTHSLSLSYFADDPALKIKDRLRLAELEIPICKQYDPAIKQGGFDIFLYLNDSLFADHNAWKTTVSKHRPDGKYGKRNRSKLIWRARTVTDLKDNPFLKIGTEFNLSVMLNNPTELQEIRCNIADLKIAAKKSSLFNKIGLSVAFFALAFTAMTAWCPIFNGHAPDWMSFNKKNGELKKEPLVSGIEYEKKETLQTKEKHGEVLAKSNSSE